jgi:hypothetical protein
MPESTNIDFFVRFYTSTGACDVFQYSVGTVKNISITSYSQSLKTSTGTKFCYKGPVKALQPEQAKTAKFCGECGTQRKESGKFCQNCGVAFPAASNTSGDLFQELKSIATGDKDGRVFLKKLLKSYFLSNLSGQELASDSALLTQFVEKVTLRQWVNGVDDETQDGKISVGQAQHLTEKLRSGSSLSDADSSLLRKFITEAPLQAGYWGVIKAGLKQLSVVGNEEVFAAALINMENPRRHNNSAKTSEFMKFLNPFGDDRLPSSRTLNYMLRRIIRQVRDLAKTNPKSFIEIASAFVMVWEGPYRARSFAAGYFFNGIRHYFDYYGRRVDRHLVAPRRSEAHPEIWDQNPDCAVKIIESGVKSEKSLSLAFQIIEDSKQVSLPVFDLNTIELAISSSYKPLQQAGFRMLLEESQASESEISISTATKLVTDASEQQFSKLIERAASADLPFGSKNLLLAILAIIDDQIVPLNRRGELGIFLLRNRHVISNVRGLYFRALPIIKVVLEQNKKDYMSRFPDFFEHLWPYELEQVLELLLNEFPKDRSFLEPLLVSFESKLDQSSRLSHSVARFFSDLIKLPGRDFKEFAWSIFDKYYSDALALLLVDYYYPHRLPEEEKSVFVRELLEHVQQSVVSELISLFMKSTHWSTSFNLIDSLAYPGSEKIAWNILGNSEQRESHDPILSSRQLVKRIGDSLQISQMLSASGAQLELVLEYLGGKSMRASLDPEFILAAATSSTVELSNAGLQALKSEGLSNSYWLRLAESGLPSCVDEALKFVKSKDQQRNWSDNVLALLDSKVDSAKKLGLRLLDSNERELDMARIWNSLTESDDPEIIARVAEEALVSELIVDEKLADLDRRVLVTRRKSRGAKESIKSRLDLESFEIAPKRLRALFELARAQNTGDREWAISRLAVLSLNGVQIPFFEAYETTGGGDSA